MRLNSSILKAILWVILVEMFEITACNSPAAVATQTTRTPVDTKFATETVSAVLPSPTLELAENYAMGVSEVPADVYLLVEYSSSNDCSLECDCPAVEPPPPAYRWTSSGEVCLPSSSYLDFDPLGAVSSGSILGLFGAGKWQEELYAITTLPYHSGPYNGIFPIYSVYSDGTIVIGLLGKTYFLKPGQSWLSGGERKNEPPPGCTIAYAERLTNFGFLKRQSIEACGY